jgi:hypothetical protein
VGDQLYALEKLVEAVHCLATGPGRVQERLAEAMTFLIRVRPEDVPDELRRQLIGIKDDLTFDQPSGSESRLEATLGRLSNEDASAIAARVLDLRNRLWDDVMGKPS